VKGTPLADGIAPQGSYDHRMPAAPRERHGALAHALTSFLDAAHEIPPHDLAALVASTAAELGATECVIWLADPQLRVLEALSPPVPRDSMAIDGTAGGRSFITCALIEAPSQEDSGVHLWLPLLDGVDRIGVLEIRADSLDDDGRESFRHLASVTAAEIITRGQYTDLFDCTPRQERMSLAAEMQWQNLPPSSYTTKVVSVTAMLEPAYDVGGDSFDYADAGGRVHLIILDAVGHDLDSSLVSVLALGAYRNCRRSEGGDLLAAADAIDRAISQQLGDGRFATGQMAILDTTKGKLRWLNAGHPPPMLFRNGRVMDLLSCPPRPPFGLGDLQPDRTTEIAEEQLEPGDAVLFYSDGVIEARRAGGEDFGTSRLQEFLHTAFAAGLAPAETVRRLSNAVLDFHGGQLEDDATTMLVVWQPERGPQPG
jgi:serine phosphatase RsbU (regulator of sigma subunit)